MGLARSQAANPRYFWGTDDLQALGVALFGVVDHQLDIPWVWPLLVLAVVSVGCLAVLRSRVRAVEIVT